MTDALLAERTRARIGIGTLIVIAGILLLLAILAGVAITIAGFL